jgi:putative Mg2+ transporter-C (MgtC) family protein
MLLTIGWTDISVRLLLTILAGALIGWNRGETGHPAGLRTSLLVCLAASLSMIETNLLLDTRGKAGDSFAVLDLARFPLGILSGMGFIGAGAILRRGGIVEGVTTAATLWFVTMIGLCLGGGQLSLGIVGTAIGYFVLSAVKSIEGRLPLDRRAILEVTFDGDVQSRDMLTAALMGRGYQIVERAARASNEPRQRYYHYELRWRASPEDAGPGQYLEELATRHGVVELSWRLGPT